MSATDLGDPDQIIHIPARDLTGTRETKLADLDMLLAQLQVVRLALCGQTVRLAGFTGAAGQGTGLPRVYRSWPVRWVWIVLDPGRSPYRSVRLV